jgi:hypothetical protein
MLLKFKPIQPIIMNALSSQGKELNRGFEFQLHALYEVSRPDDFPAVLELGPAELYSSPGRCVRKRNLYGLRT